MLSFLSLLSRIVLEEIFKVTGNVDEQKLPNHFSTLSPADQVSCVLIKYIPYAATDTLVDKKKTWKSSVMDRIGIFPTHLATFTMI